MITAARRHAENRFASIERRQQKALSDEDQKRREMDENTARLRALRLAKEASDLQAIEARHSATARKLKSRLAPSKP